MNNLREQQTLEKRVKLSHDQIVANIAEDMINRGYTDPQMFVEYKDRYGNVVGELDLYFRKGKYVLLFEVKQVDTIKHYCKAANQMKRAEQHYFNKSDRVFKFYGYNWNGDYALEWIRTRR